MTKITINNIPMDVREHLFRGQWKEALRLLVLEHGMSKDDAVTLIKDYRKSFKERNLELEMMKMQSDLGSGKEKLDGKEFYVKILLFVVAFLVLVVIISSMLG